MEYSIKFEQDIKKLKAITDPALRKKTVIMLAKSYKVSQATIYRHMKKNIPGTRDTRSDAGKEKNPVTKKQVGVVMELIKAGKPQKDVKKFLPVTDHQLAKISKKAKTTVSNKTPPIIASSIESFLRQYFKLEYISDVSIIKVKLAKVEIELTKDDFNEIVMILANAANRTKEGFNKLKLDRVMFMRSKFKRILETKIRIAEDSSSTDELKKLLSMFNDLDVKRAKELNPDVKVMEKVCKELKPDLEFDELVSLIEKYSS